MHDVADTTAATTTPATQTQAGQEDAAAPEARSAPREIVTFAIGDQSFCMEIEHVLEIRGWTKTTLLPHAPDYVVGLMNLRGNVLPVIDLSLRLGLGKTEPTQRHVIIVAVVADRNVGFLVEAVSDIVTVQVESMKPTPDVASARTRAFIKGVYSLSDDLVRALDVHEAVPGKEALAA